MDDLDLGRFMHPAFLILTSLAQEPRHGYAIMEDIQTITGLRMGPGTLYGALARLEERGLIRPLGDRDRRRPYQITEHGAKVLAEQYRRYHALVTTGMARLKELNPEW